MTNRERVIEALQGTAIDAVYRHVMEKNVVCPYAVIAGSGYCDKDYKSYRRNMEETCIKCKEDWLSQELEFEMEGITNA